MDKEELEITVRMALDCISTLAAEVERASGESLVGKTLGSLTGITLIRLNEILDDLLQEQLEEGRG